MDAQFEGFYLHTRFTGGSSHHAADGWLDPHGLPQNLEAVEIIHVTSRIPFFWKDRTGYSLFEWASMLSACDLAFSGYSVVLVMV